MLKSEHQNQLRTRLLVSSIHEGIGIVTQTKDEGSKEASNRTQTKDGVVRGRRLDVGVWCGNVGGVGWLGAGVVMRGESVLVWWKSEVGSMLVWWWKVASARCW